MSDYGYDSDDVPPLDDMMDEVDSDSGSDGVPDLEDAGVAPPPTPDDNVGGGDTLEVEPPAPLADGEEATLLDEMLAASAAATKKKKKKKAQQRKKEDATFGAGLSAKAMFSAPVVVDEGGDSDDDDGGAGAGAGAGARASAGKPSGDGGSGSGGNRVTGAGASGSSAEAKARRKRIRKVHKRPANPKQEARLLSAVAKGDVAGVRSSIALQLNLNCQAPNKGGQTPLALAAHGGNMDIVRLLLEHDADPNGVTKTGKTALMVAARAGKEDVVVALLDAGAKVLLKDGSEKTALSYAKAKKRHYIVELLTKRAADEENQAVEDSVEEEIYLTASNKPKHDSLRLEEVQAALSQATPQLEKSLKKGDWLTPDFQKNLMKNPVIARGLSNPRFVEALNEFQTNPDKAKKKFARDKDIQDFILTLYGVMGDHFTKLGEQEDAERKRKAEEAAAAEEAAKKRAMEEAVANADDDVRATLSDPQIMEILNDPAVKAAMQDAGRPGRLRYWLNDKVMGPKFRLLQRRGLVQFQM